jgi:methyltransferase-like protein/2-polyprenyl-3-methyl-5-hydroxy-6-metoxy-1,4-benzoquinol methylase
MTSIQGSTTIPATAPRVESAQQAYDDVPYGSYPVSASHPDRLYSMASLFGLNPVLPDNARILEIGCAGGGNLLPLASLFPNSTCVGVELSQVQCDYGIKAIEYTRFKNVTIQQGSVTEIGPEFGEFDYILCHGVYSWVPDFVREAILKVCSQNLSPNGVAYVSYNVMPGWYFKGMIRGMMLEHVKGIVEPLKRIGQARALLKFLVDANVNSHTTHAEFIRTEAALLQKLPDSYLMHEYLEEHNNAFYFRDFIRDAMRHKLQFLGESSIASTWLGNFSREAQKGLEPIADAIQRGHYTDCITGRTFRETYLVHAGRTINRNISTENLHEVRFSTKMEYLGAEKNASSGSVLKRYKSRTGMTIQSNDTIIQHVLECLTEDYPCSKTASQLVEHLSQKLPKELAEKLDVNHITGNLVQGVLAGWVEFRCLPDRIQKSGHKKPKITDWARCQAQAGRYATNLRHEFINLSEINRQIIPILDGTKDIPEIIREVSFLIESGLLKVQLAHDATNIPASEIPKRLVDEVLSQLAMQSLLMPEA